MDFIAAEDTRVTRKLCSRFEIHTPLISYHEHNRHQASGRIIDRLMAGESAALVTDAGMPAISDPGEESGGALPSKRGAGGGGARPERSGHRPGRVGAVLRAFYL